MKNIILSGCGGRLGSAIARRIGEREDCRVIAGIDPRGAETGAPPKFPVYLSPSEVPDCTANEADAVIDCSHHTAVAPLLDFCVSHGIPAVIATTGHTEEETERIRTAARTVPVLYSRNMSLGVHLLIELVRRAAAALGEDFDVEIVEQHHNRKLDAPSGTALMIADAVRSVRPESEYVYDRHSVHRPREKQEIGIHSIRGGTIVGEHEVIFAGTDEVIRLSHSAASRDVFAAGAIRAAFFVADAQPGLYSMSEVVAASGV
jgi:4-hydroxy-tetrahydrodipicolinate reductase